MDVFAFGISPMAGESGLLTNLYSLAVLLPPLGVTVRRLHDVGKSGWYILIALIPLVGAIWLLILFFTDSKPGTKKGGANPKEEHWTTFE